MLATNVISLIWDLAREAPTLGGAFVLRMEGELLTRDCPEETIPIHVLGVDNHAASVSRLFEQVFASSARRFELRPETSEPDGAWPAPSERRGAGFSYFSFARLLSFYATSRCAPRLTWAPHISERAAAVRANFTETLICVHLRRVPPFAAEESNADPTAWRSFLEAHATSGRARFLLLGDDPLPAGLSIGGGIVRANELGIPLAVQLALVAQADGFIGMASGLCTAANLSDTPHVIFKHPAHHPVAMRAELGDANRFPFATPRQQLWRRIADRAALDEALDLVLP